MPKKGSTLDKTKWGRRVMSHFESALSTYGCLYTFGFLYVATNILLFLREAFEEASFHKNYRRYVTSISRGSGAVINFNAALVLLLASRSLLSLLRTTPLNLVLPIDKAMPDLHRLVGTVTLSAAILHSGTHVAVYFISELWSPGLKGFTSLFITGFLLLGLLLIIRLVATPSSLHQSYESFYRIHIGCSIIFFGLLIFHGLHRGEYNTWKYVIGPIVVYVFDIIIRTMRQQKVHLILSKHSTACQAANIVKIRIPRVFHFKAGQYAELKVPLISSFQWHPFTIASAPHEAEIVFYIKAVGDWTKSLYRLFERRSLLNNDDVDYPGDIEIFIRGPFGAPAQHVGQFDRVILIGGGVGATPFCSIVKDSYYWITNWSPRNVRRRQTTQNDSKKNYKDRHETPQHGNNHDMNSDRNDHNLQTDDSSRRRSISISTRQVVPSPTRPGTEITMYSKASRVQVDANQSWHFVATNVISEGNPSELSIPVDDHEDRPTALINEPKRKSIVDGDLHSSKSGTNGSTSMCTARDFHDVHSNSDSVTPSPLQSQRISGNSRRNTIQFVSEYDIEAGDPENAITRVETEHSIANEDLNTTGYTRRKSKMKLKKKRLVKRNSLAEEDGNEYRRGSNGDDMRGYYGNSSGSHRHSLDYMSALNAIAYDEDVDDIFQKSIDMMVGMSFGSVSAMKSIQYKIAQQSIRNGKPEDVASAAGPKMFESRSIMFLLYMRSVTTNMVILWLLIARFIIAGGAFTVREFRLFIGGIQLYNHAALNAIDLVICVILVILFALPSVIEAIELGVAPLHGLDIFVLTPIAIFGVVIDILALRNIASGADAIFNVFHVLLVWPILTIMVMIRLLGVIGERITQVETVAPSHATTRTVDFYWTAPTSGDDAWLVDELLRYTDIKQVRLHRYLTREREAIRDMKHDNIRDVIVRSNGDMVVAPMEGEDDVDTNNNSGNNNNSTGTLRTNHGRPNWSEIFESIAKRSENNSTIGVFFCGPSSMAQDVQAASMEAMRNSIVRGLTNSVRGMRGLEEIFGDAMAANEHTGDIDKTHSTEGREPSTHGCNITIVFKKESFS